MLEVAGKQQPVRLHFHIKNMMLPLILKNYFCEEEELN